MDAMQKVRFEIEEDFLVAYRAYDYAPGSQSPTTSGDNNTDTPVPKYDINSHFDIKREYNPATGEQSNVLGEHHRSALESAPVHPGRLVAEPDPRGHPPDPEAALSSGGRRSASVTVGQNELSPSSTRTVRFSRATTSISPTSTPRTRLSRLLHCCSAPMTRSDRGGAARRRSRSATRCSPSWSARERPARVSGPRADPRHGRQAGAGRVQLHRDHSLCTATALKAAGLTGDDCTEAALDQFAKFGYFRTCAPDLRPAGRRDARRT